MWKAALLLLAEVLRTVQGTYAGGLGVPSWEERLAVVMQGHNVQTGTSGDMCYVRVGVENRVLQRGESFIHDADPCLRYICESSGVQQQHIECPAEVTCSNGPPVRFPGQCCQQCVGISELFTDSGEWSKWTECSRTCGVGRRARARTITTTDSAGKLEQYEQTEIDKCQTYPCPVDCEWEWEPFDQCSRTCGRGTRGRFPLITQHSQDGGRPCPPNVLNRIRQTVECNADPCTVDCKWKWGPFGKCSRSICGGGTRSRFPIITQHARYGGKGCPEKVVNKIPQTASCPGNPYKPDSDGDGVVDACDNCIYAYNPEQENNDGDSTGDACDEDDDNDGILDSQDNCPLIYNPKQGSKDSYSYGDKCFLPKGSSAMRMDNYDMLTASDKKGLAARIMEKLLDMYYSNYVAEKRNSGQYVA